MKTVVLMSKEYSYINNMSSHVIHLVTTSLKNRQSTTPCATAETGAGTTPKATYVTRPELFTFDVSVK